MPSVLRRPSMKSPPPEVCRHRVLRGASVWPRSAWDARGRFEIHLKIGFGGRNLRVGGNRCQRAAAGRPAPLRKLRRATSGEFRHSTGRPRAAASDSGMASANLVIHKAGSLRLDVSASRSLAPRLRQSRPGRAGSLVAIQAFTPVLTGYAKSGTPLPHSARAPYGLRA